MFQGLAERSSASQKHNHNLRPSSLIGKMSLNKFLKCLQVKFSSKIWHPNVSKTGFICLDVLKDKWSVALSIESSHFSIIQLLASPNAEDPLNRQAASQLLNDADKFKEIARKYSS